MMNERLATLFLPASNYQLVGDSTPTAAAAAAPVKNNKKTIFDVPDAVLALSFAFVGNGNCPRNAPSGRMHCSMLYTFHNSTTTG
eukprot:scaffold10163_cov270-Chaetoceros_neogracile.AAC.53